MRKDKAFSREVIRQALPGHAAAIARRTGYELQTVQRALRDLVAAGVAYQRGWVKASRYVPTYALGQPLPGFVLPPMPKGQTKAQREAKYRKTKAARKRINATERRRYAKNREAINEARRKTGRRVKPKPQADAMLHIVATLIAK